jgi:hypothetical protein
MVVEECDGQGCGSTAPSGVAFPASPSLMLLTARERGDAQTTLWQLSMSGTLQRRCSSTWFIGMRCATQASDCSERNGKLTSITSK